MKKNYLCLLEKFIKNVYNYQKNSALVNGSIKKKINESIKILQILIV
jgi:hypothetical protein